MAKIVGKKITFTVKVPVDPDDENNKETKEVPLEVRQATIAQTTEAQCAYNRAFDKAMRSKAPTRIEVKALLEERKIWTEEHETKYKQLNTELSTMVNNLVRGGRKLSEARKLAIDIIKKRNEMADLDAGRRVLDQNTAEAQAESARFNWFVANCTVYPVTGKPFFCKEEDPDDTDKRVEAYIEQSLNEYAQECARKFGALQYGLDPDFKKKWPEYQFLLKFKMVRPSDLRLINSDGHLIDIEGNLVDEEGYRVNKDENRIDATGIPLDKQGHPKVETGAFLDEEGNPIADSELSADAVQE